MNGVERGKSWGGLILTLIMLSFTAPGVHAKVPMQMNYQGYLTDTGGVPVNDTVSITFSLYAVPSGGSALWWETHSVMVTDGVYNVVLGNTNPLSPGHFVDHLYLGIQAGNDNEMAPRQKITSIAFAVNAALLDGQDASAFAPVDHDHSFAEITGTAADGQIPDNITITYSASAGDADTLDGMDSTAFGDITGVTAGAGLSGGGTSGTVTVNASFAGTGTAATIARSDHTHDGRYYTESEVNGLISGLQTQIDALQATVDNLTALLAGITRNGDNIVFSGVNVQVVNGTGTTYGIVNGLGNIIVGYNELRGSGDDRTGSHNIVVGIRHNYSSYGGLVAGNHNTISAGTSSVTGGKNNTASGDNSSVSGGVLNTASGMFSSVSGGYNNTASGAYSSVSGGLNRSVSGNYDWRAGGLFQDQ